MTAAIWDFLKELTNPESIINYGGWMLLFFVVFAETGLFIGFFLPGDSLLFTAGLLCGIGLFKIDINLLVIGLCVSAIAGNSFGYWFGAHVGPALFKKEDSLLFKKKHLEITRTFYAKHGGKAIVLGRFLPIVRTFVPILAGVIKVDLKKFMGYNIAGSLIWVGVLTLSGFFLGREFPETINYLEYIVIILIAITLIPIIVNYRKK